jgi:two-component system, NtrC family, nitrogen regulation sensor histidine kinase NtrY
MVSERGTRPGRLPLERRIPLLVLFAGLPAAVVAFVWLWTGNHGVEVRWTLSVVILVIWLGCAIAARERVVRPLQVLSNLLAGLREGDYSVRGAGGSESDALGMVMTEVNALGGTLQMQRLGALEATALLRTVIAELDVAVFAFDEHGRLRLVNRGGERLLDQPSERLLGRTAAALGLDDHLRDGAPRLVDATFPGGAGRWEVRRRWFREDGLPHQLLVLTDLSHALREEERLAWQRIIRVLSHEINNSLAPIKSISRTLRRLMARQPRTADCDEEVQHGLAVIEGRSGSLSRFLQSYARLAQLPKPDRRVMRVEDWVRTVAGLEERLRVDVRPGPPAEVRADRDQLDQLLINLVRNAVDAAIETGGGVAAGWELDGGQLRVFVEDEGPGLADTANLFVPFFTTKPSGSGIGLALSRQIAEAHGGTLTLEDRRDARGCIATLRLPVDHSSLVSIASSHVSAS